MLCVNTIHILYIQLWYAAGWLYCTDIVPLYKVNVIFHGFTNQGCL